MLFVFIPLDFGESGAAERQELTAAPIHLRNHGDREWTEFAERPQADRIAVTFKSEKNASELSLTVRQQDVKQGWFVRLNDRRLGKLVVDENDMVVVFPVPAGALKDGENVLAIEPAPGKSSPDDVLIGPVTLEPVPRSEWLAQCSVEVDVRDRDTGASIPCRLTIVNADGALQTVGAESNSELAIRPGIVYTATGAAKFGLPAGKYRLHAGRGFEYSLDAQSIEATPGATVRVACRIRREVPTAGYVACDTHVHTLTHSGHGDATIEERMITLAGEGVELPIATDHDKHIDYEQTAQALGVRKYFTPVVGNEVTTALGHFNVFPARAGASPPDHLGGDWPSIFRAIQSTPDVKVIILNHARDIHSNVRPFGPRRQNAAVGANLDGWNLRANAMEVVNSGSVQSDVMPLFHDWMTQLNRGRFLTPVGGSDSHDVGRHFVGQARTYIRARDDDASAISVDEAVRSFLTGRVMVSYGLLTELTIDGRFSSGDVAPVPNSSVTARIRVLGPSWVQANRVALFANGRLLREEQIDARSEASRRAPGVLWEGEWALDRPSHDVHLVAMAFGPGIEGSFWKTAKPYQPRSPDWTSYVVGASGAVWLDVDGDGRRTPAIDYASAVVAAAGEDPALLTEQLASYDEAVAAQAAFLWDRNGHDLSAPETRAALKKAASAVQKGFEAFEKAKRDSAIARLESSNE